MADNDQTLPKTFPDSAVNDDPCEDQNLLKTNVELKIKDEGYAWVVLFATFSINVLMFGYNRSFGILSASMLNTYPDASGVTIGLIMGLLSGCRSIFAPVIGTLTNIFGIRRSLFFGSSLYFMALVSSFFCTTMMQLCFTLGAMNGLSQGIIQCSQAFLLPQYFEKKFSLANGIYSSSNPLGGLLFPFLVSFLLDYYGLRSTLLIFGGITAHVFIFSILMRPIKMQMKIKSIEKTNQIFKEIYSENSEGELFIPNANNEEINSNEWTMMKRTSGNIKKLLFKEIMLKNNHILEKRPIKRLEFNFFKNFQFIMYIVLAAVSPCGLFLTVYYTAIYAQTIVGLSSYEVSILLSFKAIFDFTMRIFFGWFNNKNLFPKSYTLLVCLWISGIGKFLIPFATNLPTLIILISICTLGVASFVTSFNVMLIEDFGKEHITTTFGFTRMTNGLFIFLNSLMIGYILDLTGSFYAPFFVMGTGTFACSSLIGIQILVKKLRPSNEDRS